MVKNLKIDVMNLYLRSINTFNQYDSLYDGDHSEICGIEIYINSSIDYCITYDNFYNTMSSYSKINTNSYKLESMWYYA